jgi:hypothetical protein
MILSGVSDFFLVIVCARSGVCDYKDHNSGHNVFFAVAPAQLKHPRAFAKSKGVLLLLQALVQGRQKEWVRDG